MTARGIRNNNPGNLDFNQGAYLRDPWMGERGLEDHEHARFTTFDMPVFGIRALCKVLLTYQRKHGCNTVRKIIDRWAPSRENDTEAYIESVCDVLGVGSDVPVNLERDATRLKLLATAIIYHENGEQPYSESLLEDAVSMALA